jgi:hypothetical protein
MTTTPEVPMPEPDIHVAIDTDGIPRSLQGRFYTADQVRDTAIKYADARCAALQAERDAMDKWTDEFRELLRQAVAARDALEAVKSKAIALCDALDAGEDARPAYLHLRAAIDAAGVANADNS